MVVKSTTQIFTFKSINSLFSCMIYTAQYNKPRRGWKKHPLVGEKATIFRGLWILLCIFGWIGYDHSDTIRPGKGTEQSSCWRCSEAFWELPTTRPRQSVLNSLSNILKSMILPESLLKNQKKIKTKNNKGRKKQKK